MNNSALTPSASFSTHKHSSSILTIYHGSKDVIKKPMFGKGKSYNDYGLGFYTTKDKELAGEWAVLNTGRDGYINEYVIEMSDLKTLNLDEIDVKHWVAILMDNRKGRYSDEVYSEIEAFKQKYLLDISDYDIIIGWRADDAYFQYVEAFASRNLSIENLLKAMELGNLGQQICIKTVRAFNGLKYITSHEALFDVFYKSATDRDLKARVEYRGMFRSGIARQGTLMDNLL